MLTRLIVAFLGSLLFAATAYGQAPAAGPVTTTAPPAPPPIATDTDDTYARLSPEVPGVAPAQNT